MSLEFDELMTKADAPEKAEESEVLAPILKISYTCESIFIVCFVRFGFFYWRGRIRKISRFERNIREVHKSEKH